MKIIDYSMLSDDWEVLGDNGFVSPLNAKQSGQMIIFPEIVKNGSISADITPLEGHPGQSGEKSADMAPIPTTIWVCRAPALCGKISSAKS